MKPKNTWIVVANGQLARALELDHRGKRLMPLPDRIWEAPEKPPYDDVQGHTNSSTSRSVHRLSPSTRQDKQQAEFAATLSDALQEAFRAGAFEVLHLTAAPHMLGLLRPLIDEPIKACIASELAKDLTNMKPAEVFDLLGL